MTEPKFTPGPWRLTRDSEGGKGILFVEAKWPYHDDSGSGDIIVSVGQPNHQDRDPDFYPELEVQKLGNARLIAAAPELYQALAKVSDMLFARPDMVATLRPMMGPAEHAICDIAAAALAKARGEP